MSNWLYKDAILLKKAGRNRSSLLLLFCLIDTLAKRNSRTNQVIKIGKRK